MITYSIIPKSQLKSAHRLDAEYFQPEYLKIDKEICNSNYKLWGKIEGRFITGPFGSEFNVDNYVLDGGFRYVRGKDIKEFFLLDDDNVYIPQKDFDRLKKYSLEDGDILISVVGTLGNAVIVDDSVPPAIFSCKSTIFRSKSINPYYLIAYLNSRYGRGLLIRSARGAVQTGLNIDDLKFLPITEPSIDKQRAIAEIVIAAQKARDESKTLYSQAENLLLQELGLKNFKPEEDLSYVVNFSHVKSAQRFDAEYFQPKYEKMTSKILGGNTKMIGEITVLVGHSTQPPYDETGTIAVLAQKHMSNNLAIDISTFDNFTSEKHIKTNDRKFLLKDGDILISSAGKPGLTCVWIDGYEGRVIPGSFVTVVRLSQEVNPLYIGVFLNTLAGNLQFERNYSGSVQQYVYPSKIKEILVPILPKSTQQRVADLVRKSREARKKAKELLEEAKRKVEEVIEIQ